MTFYEIRCVWCGARFNPPDEHFDKHSDVRKYIPKNVKVFRRHRPIVGKLADYEEIWLTNKKVHRKLSLVSGNLLEHEWEETENSLKPINIPAYDRYSQAIKSGLLKVNKKTSIEEFAKDNFLYDEIQDIINEVRNLDHHQVKRRGDSIVIYANKDERIIENSTNKKKLILLDRNYVDIDGSFCHSFTIEAEDFEEKPMRAKVETRKLENGRIEYIYKCPECGAVAVRIIK